MNDPIKLPVFERITAEKFTEFLCELAPRLGLDSITPECFASGRVTWIGRRMVIGKPYPEAFIQSDLEALIAEVQSTPKVYPEPSDNLPAKE